MTTVDDDDDEDVVSLDTSNCLAGPAKLELDCPVGTAS
jgi:hypothetical protein